VIHRDLKPDNILLTPSDREFPLRVIDWGVARLGPLGRLTLDGLTPGTPIYMSPEQATGRNIAAACDIYSLGVIAYELLAGHPPFDGRSLAEVVSMHLTSSPAPLTDTPSALSELVHRMLDKEPSHRPCAIEVRQVARSLGLELSSAYESIEIIRGEPRVPTEKPRRALALSAQPTQDALVVDPDALDFMRKPRWTPDLETVPLQPGRPAITPDGGEAVAGELDVPKPR
jgi:serine/threonine protein kinase, bacterial